VVDSDAARLFSKPASQSLVPEEVQKKSRVRPTGADPKKRVLKATVADFASPKRRLPHLLGAPRRFA
jgi:hypothetical protein